MEDQSLREDFVEKVKGRTPDGNNSWDMISKIIREVAKETLGETQARERKIEKHGGGKKKFKRRLPARQKRRKGEILIYQKRLREYKEACKIAK